MDFCFSLKDPCIFEESEKTVLESFQGRVSNKISYSQGSTAEYSQFEQIVIDFLFLEAFAGRECLPSIGIILFDEFININLESARSISDKNIY